MPVRCSPPHWRAVLARRVSAHTRLCISTVGADGDWDFPNQSVLVKHFRVAGKLIETVGP